ncbi:unnamed protein product, partial [Amoebophrya sp. A120]
KSAPAPRVAAATDADSDDKKAQKVALIAESADTGAGEVDEAVQVAASAPAQEQTKPTRTTSESRGLRQTSTTEHHIKILPPRRLSTNGTQHAIEVKPSLMPTTVIKEAPVIASVSANRVEKAVSSVDPVQPLTGAASDGAKSSDSEAHSTYSGPLGDAYTGTKQISKVPQSS